MPYNLGYLSEIGQFTFSIEEAAYFDDRQSADEAAEYLGMGYPIEYTTSR